jgi:predicted DCC family thiol-disulfide oxidoreductase YuxK
MADEEPVIIAYDGECMMCSGSIRFLAEKDRRHRLRFVPLQTPLGRGIEQQAGNESLSTVIVRKNGKVFTHSDAICQILKTMGGPWALLGKLGLLLPKGLRDRLYRFIARNRYRWFGKADTCSLPSPALRERLIDGDRV